MKVLCVNGLKSGYVSPTSGEIYTVIDEITVMGRVGYVLEDKLPHWVYDARRFAPLSNIDETELIKERQTSTIKEIQ